MLTAIQQPFFVAVFILLGICMIACLIAAIRGPELGDRIVAANMIGTLTIATICLLSYALISAAIGVYRFSECLTRMHAAAMGDTLGLGLIILGLIVLFGFSFTTVKLVLVVAFLWTTGPVSSHLIAQMMVEKKKKREEEEKEK